MGGAEKLCSLVSTVVSMEVPQRHTHTERGRERVEWGWGTQETLTVTGGGEIYFSEVRRRVFVC